MIFLKRKPIRASLPNPVVVELHSQTQSPSSLTAANNSQTVANNHSRRSGKTIRDGPATPFATVRTQTQTQSLRTMHDGSSKTIRDGPNPNPNPIVVNHSRMVRNDWVWVWVRTVANGSQRLGSDCRKWFCQSHREWFATIRFGFGFEPSRMVINDGLGVRLDEDWVWE